MKLIVIVVVFVSVVANDNHYDNKYDNFDVDAVTGNDRLMFAYVHCLLGDGKCTPEGNDMKKWVPESTRTACAKCTSKQKILVAKFIKAIITKMSEEWEILSKRYDPEGKRKVDLQKFLDENAS